ncbi:MAG: AAA family ATPase [Planctomycetes bacterium]|nr:AAA family ATPase [Planctomycetota bacterium]
MIGNDDVRFVRVSFENFKALKQYSVDLGRMNIMVGPNNCGKSTILSAFRTLHIALRRARAKSSEVLNIDGTPTRCYRLSDDTVPISLENVHTDYVDAPSRVTFFLSNSAKLELLFSKDGKCTLIPRVEGQLIKTPTSFRNAFPVDLAIVPVLGPVEHNEPIVNEQTIASGLSTHRASRHFRNYWFFNSDGFEEFSDLVSKTWPGMSIQRPQRPDALSQYLTMFCQEDRIDREIYWSGFGFQVWCQLLTHISRAKAATALVVDEPEIYLHPDVQRQLLGILRSAGPDIMLATHSTEIIADAEPSEILLVDKRQSNARRLKDFNDVQGALEAVGSVQNIVLANLSRTRRALYIEGSNDYKLIRRFAAKIGLDELASGVGITPVESGGFSSWETLQKLARGFEQTLGTNLRLAAVYDRDYYCDEQISSIEKSLNASIAFGYFHKRKEIENYLLEPEVLQRAIDRLLKERASRNGSEPGTCDVRQLLSEITDPMQNHVCAQYVARRCEYMKHCGEDMATMTARAMEWFTTRWSDLDARLEIVPGKEVLRQLRSIIAGRHRVSMTDARILESFHRGDVATDLESCLRSIDLFRKS